MDNPREVGDSSAHAGNAQALSNQIFANPVDFLSTLKNDFKQISGGDDAITKSQLEIYSEQGSDPKGRAAAALAAKNFDSLTHLGITEDTVLSGRGAIEKGDLDTDIAYAQGNLSSIKGNDIEQDVITGGSSAVVGAVGLVATALALESPVSVPGAIAMGSFTFSLGAAAAASVYGAFTASGRIDTASQRVQSEIGSWIK
jgi:hypothetical protein